MVAFQQECKAFKVKTTLENPSLDIHIDAS